ncbi:MAG: peptidoglycan-binding protein [Gemmatimonadota bacterium]
MARTLFARGARGVHVQRAQQRLQELRMPLDSADGMFGGNTESALKQFQQMNALPVTGQIDFDLWPRLTGDAEPTLEERALQLTAAIEGHGYTLAVGNFDGAGLTWGIIGFTVMAGQVQGILDAVATEHPGMIRATFVDLTADLERLRKMSVAKQIDFLDGISVPPGKHRLVDPWRIAFDRLGAMREVQEIQRRFAFQRYMEPAKQTFRKLGLTTELGLALCFDIHVQNGSIKSSAMTAINAAGARTEAALRVAIANAVADQSREKYREDVRSRKLAIATGRGVVHGMTLDLANWGLADVPA